MSNGWAACCKIFAWLTLAAGVIIGIVIGVKIEIWWPFFVSTGSSFVTFLLFGTLGYIADNVEGGGYYVSSPRPNWANSQSESDSFKPFKLDDRSVNTLTSSSSKKTSPAKNGYWRCPKCGLSNPDYCGTCSCGTKQPK